MSFTFEVMAILKRGTIIELEIERLAFGGRGVGRSEEGIVLFVENAIPGQRVSARVKRVRRNHAEAVLESVVRESPLAVPPRCSHHGICGGCRLQHLDYEAQLQEKRVQVLDALTRLGGFSLPVVEETVPSPRIYGYRNKMEYSFGAMRWLTPEEMERKEEAPDRTFALGLHPKGRWDRVIQLQECYLPPSPSVEIMQMVRESASNSGYPPFSTRTHRGFWRFLIVRLGVHTGQWLVDLITSDDADAFGEVDRLAGALTSRFPEISSFTHTLSSTKAAVATGDRIRMLHGPGFIEEEIAGLQFRISPRAFFQTNTEGAERLYSLALELAALKPDERVYDVYCGTGTIALLMAREAGEVVGIELETSAVVDARANAERNGISNARFVEGDAAALLKEGPVWGEPDLVVVDPPRAGLHPDLREMLPQLGARRLVYVSCNPTTLARDLKEICRNGFELQVVQPVDMFPHTPHVECVTLLERSSG